MTTPRTDNEDEKNAAAIVQGLNDDCKVCLENLEKKISSEIQKLPAKEQIPYKINEEVNVQMVVGLFNQQDKDLAKHASSDLKLALEGYAAVQEIQKPLRPPLHNPHLNITQSTPSLTSLQKLEKVGEIFNKPAIQQSLKSQTDSKFKRFCTKVEHFLKRVSKMKTQEAAPSENVNKLASAIKAQEALHTLAEDSNKSKNTFRRR